MTRTINEMSSPRCGSSLEKPQSEIYKDISSAYG